MLIRCFDTARAALDSKCKLKARNLFGKAMPTDSARALSCKSLQQRSADSSERENNHMERLSQVTEECKIEDENSAAFTLSKDVKDNEQALPPALHPHRSYPSPAMGYEHTSLYYPLNRRARTASNSGSSEGNRCGKLGSRKFAYSCLEPAETVTKKEVSSEDLDRSCTGSSNIMTPGASSRHEQACILL